MATIKCEVCGKAFQVVPARLGTAKWCSMACAGKARARNYLGENNPKWRDAVRTKTCQHCGKEFSHKGGPLVSFEKRKFCSQACIVAGQKRLRGAEHPRYREDARRRHRTGKHYVAWQTAVISRDKATCQACGARGVELHAHHIKPWESHPELRFDVTNGTTVCARCHWQIHSAGNENPVNSVKPRPGKAEGNTEPSLERKLIEGVTTRGRAYRRVEMRCEWCGSFVSKTIGRAKQANHHFCSRSCASKFTQANRQRQ